MHITILTLFPQMFPGPLGHSIIGRAIKQKFVDLTMINIRDFSKDSYQSVDDKPYGGGQGMVMRIDIADKAITHAKSLYPDKKPFVILLDPQGVPYKQSHASNLTKKEHLIFFCSHYEGIDERIRSLVDQEISLGDYVLTGGELPAMVIIDSVVRLLPGVLPKEQSPKEESFTTSPNLLEYPHYTKPQSYKGTTVPEILLSGNHKEIQKWRDNESKKRTKERRPDLATHIR